MKTETWHKIIWLTIFSIAMGFLECAVVVYLRALLYPGGFHFPLVITISPQIAKTEFLREFATLLMLLGVGYLTGRNFAERFAGFIFGFAVWDIFYYIFLKLMLNWPDSFFTWDILFLIPVSWIGPVLAPVILSCTMILLAWSIMYFSDKLVEVRINYAEWLLFAVGSVIVIISFTYDFVFFLLQHYSISDMMTLANTQALYKLASRYVPVSFNWCLFFSGDVFLWVAVYLFVKRNRKLELKDGIFRRD
ncbi:MAG: hypothetical protein Q8907_08245 [Bacteroidota bacterium]|nr:hypothetical protein [Bacteroidota bacterium]MDP4228666.1 hypothetical protein [Bacteroidota bacterium]MDP4274253.1 hypothetical protein [Bacteroidota bacterium]